MLYLVMNLSDNPKDKKKLEELFSIYEKMMYQVAFRILRHHQDTEDALMQAWEKIAKNLDRISEIECPQTKSFIVVIVERTAIDLYRKNKKRWNFETSADKLEESPVAATVDREIDNIELAETLRKLPKGYAEVMTMYYMNSMSMDTIASILGKSVEAVKKRIQRGRSILAKEMGIDE